VELQLAKYHGLGNDFLVQVDLDGHGDIGPAATVALCDRHRGVGADGVLRLSRGRRPGSLRMELRNADGGLAETSGNGLRCAALAAVHAALVTCGDLILETAAGDSEVHVGQLDVAGAAEVRVAMGTLVVGEELAASGLPLGSGTVCSDASGPARRAVQDALAGRVARRVDAGNPHVVIYERSPAPTDRSAIDVAAVGQAIENGAAGGVNVEVVEVRGDSLSMIVWERGAGMTLACGSGSCAAAAAGRAAGLVGDRVEVTNPGGILLVELSGPALRPAAVLTGPARRVATVTVDLADLAYIADLGAFGDSERDELTADRDRARVAGAASAARAGVARA